MEYLEKAAESIALDNGAINRFEERAVIVPKMIEAAKTAHSQAELEETETFLGGLSQEDLDVVCCGEIQDDDSVPDTVNSVLETMFNSM
jgi:hypothetical protein